MGEKHFEVEFKFLLYNMNNNTLVHIHYYNHHTLRQVKNPSHQM